MTQIERMQQLIVEMDKESRAYYLLGDPIVPDHVYDAQFDELTFLERETGVILGGSPTQKVSETIADEILKVKHMEPMLSADKCHSAEEMEAFLHKNGSEKSKLAHLSWKEDGLTLVATYENGKCIKLVTRGDGEYGDDVTQNAKGIIGLPSKIREQGRVVVRGECVVSWEAFNALNSTLGEPFSHPRGMAVGSVRLQDPAAARKRPLYFKAFELVQPQMATKSEQWGFMSAQGFDVVEHFAVTEATIADAMEKMDPTSYPFPVDGMIAEYDDEVYGRSLGSTGHHERRKMAYKWPNEAKETVFRRVELRPTRTGKVSLTAVFDPVELDGSTVSRATLHNLNFFEQLKLGEGDKIMVMKANMIIPAIKENLTKSGTYKLPGVCPCCGAALERVTPNQTSFLSCPNPECATKQVRRFAHFVSKAGMNVVGMSESVIEKLLASGLLHHLDDIYDLAGYEKEIAEMDGMGETSAKNLIAAIEKSRDTTLAQILTAMGIPLLGKSNAKDLSRYCEGSVDRFYEVMYYLDQTEKIPGFGPTLCASLQAWWNNEDNKNVFNAVVAKCNTRTERVATGASPLSGKKVCITGTLSIKRDEMTKRLEGLGAKVTGSVSSSTDYLLAGADAGGKLEKAKQCGVKILFEADLEKLMGREEA